MWVSDKRSEEISICLISKLETFPSAFSIILSLSTSRQHKKHENSKSSLQYLFTLEFFSQSGAFLFKTLMSFLLAASLFYHCFRQSAVIVRVFTESENATTLWATSNKSAFGVAFAFGGINSSGNIKPKIHMKEESDF